MLPLDTNFQCINNCGSFARNVINVCVCGYFIYPWGANIVWQGIFFSCFCDEKILIGLWHKFIAQTSFRRSIQHFTRKPRSVRINNKIWHHIKKKTSLRWRWPWQCQLIVSTFNYICLESFLIHSIGLAEWCRSVFFLPRTYSSSRLN